MEKLDRKLIIEKSKVENFKAIFPHCILRYNNRQNTKNSESEIMYNNLYFLTIMYRFLIQLHEKFRLETLNQIQQNLFRS